MYQFINRANTIKYILVPLASERKRWTAYEAAKSFKGVRLSTLCGWASLEAKKANLDIIFQRVLGERRFR
jgi:hypothetical protein